MLQSYVYVLAVLKILTTPIFWNLFNCKTEGDTPEKQVIKSQDLREIYQFDFRFFVDLFSVKSYRCLKKLERYFETASILLEIL